MFGILPCVCLLRAPRKASVMIVVHKVALAGASCVDMSLSSPVALPATSVPDYRPVSFLSLAGWSCQLQRIMPAHTRCGSCTSGNTERLSNWVVIKNSYSYICSLKWYQILKMQTRNINHSSKVLKYRVGTKITFITLAGRVLSQAILAKLRK